MKPVFKVLLMAIAYLLTFILGASSGAIHPACYAYVGAVLPFLFALEYLYTCTVIRSFGAATVLNGFILILFLIVGEADTAFIIGIIVLTALAEIIRYVCKYDTIKGVRRSFIPFAFSFFAYPLTGGPIRRVPWPRPSRRCLPGTTSRCSPSSTTSPCWSSCCS